MLDAAIIAAFVVYSIASGLRSRRIASRDLTEYFLAGRTLRGWRAGISMAATQYAADTPLLVAGLVALGGVFSLWRLWIYGIAFLLMGFLLGKAWRRAGVLTDAELTEIRYSGPGVPWLRALKAVYYGTVINCVVMAFVLVAATRIFEVFLPWHEWLPAALYDPVLEAVRAAGLQLWSGTARLAPEVASANSAISIAATLGFVALYSMTGGLRSVVSTDVAQFGFMMVGTLIYALVALHEVGGIDGLSEALRRQYGAARSAELVSFVPPASEALMPLLVVLSLQWLFQMNSDGTGYLAQRTMACASDREARIAALTFTVSQIVLRSLLWLPIALALLVLYPMDPNALATEALVAQREIAFVDGIDRLLPMGLRGLMVTALLAALASTIDTHLNWGASYWSNDLYRSLWVERLRGRRASSRELVLVARLSNLLVLALALVVMGNLGSIQAGWQTSLLFGAGIGSVLLLRWLWERINLWCEIVAIVCSLALAPLLLHYVADDWLRLAIMAGVSTSMVVATALLAPATEPEHLAEFYRRVEPPGWWARTAARAGRDPHHAIGSLAGGFSAMLYACISVYGLLVGLGTLLVQPQRWLEAGAIVVLALLAVPLWARQL